MKKELSRQALCLVAFAAIVALALGSMLTFRAWVEFLK